MTALFQGESFSLRVGVLIQATEGLPLKNVEIKISHGRVLEIKNFEKHLTKPSENTLDLSSFVAMPGLIDAHVHFSGDQIIPPNEWGHQPRTSLLAKAQTAANQYLKAGITTVRDCGSLKRVMIELRDSINERVVPGPEILSCDQVITTPRGHGHFIGIEVKGDEDCAKAVESLVSGGVDFIKVICSGGGGTPGTYPWETQFSLGELETIVDRSHRYGKRVAAHAHSVDSIRNCLLAGVDTIEHSTFITQTGYQRESSVLKLAEKSKTWFVPTVSCYRNPVMAGIEKSFIQKIGADKFAFTNFHLATLSKLYDLGVNLAAGTDGIQVGVGPEAIKDEVRYFVEATGSPLFAIRAATCFAAQALGIGHDRGTIEVGKRADFIILDKNPLEDLSALDHIKMVIKDGRPVMIDGANDSKQFS